MLQVINNCTVCYTVCVPIRDVSESSCCDLSAPPGWRPLRRGGRAVYFCWLDCHWGRQLLSLDTIPTTNWVGSYRIHTRSKHITAFSCWLNPHRQHLLPWMKHNKQQTSKKTDRFSVYKAATRRKKKSGYQACMQTTVRAFLYPTSGCFTRQT